MRFIYTLATLTLLTAPFLANETPNYPRSTDISQKSKPATIKILLERKAPDAVLEIKGRYYVYNPLDGVQISSGTSSKRNKILSEEYGLKWGEKFPGLHQIRLVPGDSQSAILVNGVQYKGCIEVYATEGKINIINEVDIETFLQTTLTKQIPEGVEGEVLNALTIIARTNAYYTALKNKNSFWHLSAKECGYQGATSRIGSKHLEKALETTRHAILTYHNEPFAAAWTKDSAGKTVGFSSVFRKAIQSPSGVDAPLAAKEREKHHWSFSFSRQKLAELTHLSTIAAIDIYVVPGSPKAYAVKLSSEDQVQDIDFFTFQKMIGENRLKSNDFTVSMQGDNLIFNGYGEGAGVGLCLYSAHLMAQKGEKAPQMLSSFFPETRLEKARSMDAF